MFSWDERKRLSNLRKHRIDFCDAEKVFDGYTLTAEDTSESYGEQRFLTLGLLHGVSVSVAHTERLGAVRILSIRTATKDEARYYFKTFTD